MQELQALRDSDALGADSTREEKLFLLRPVGAGRLRECQPGILEPEKGGLLR